MRLRERGEDSVTRENKTEKRKRGKAEVCESERKQKKLEEGDAAEAS